MLLFNPSVPKLATAHSGIVLWNLYFYATAARQRKAVCLSPDAASGFTADRDKQRPLKFENPGLAQ